METFRFGIRTALAWLSLLSSPTFGSAVPSCASDLLVAAQDNAPLRIYRDGDRRHIEFDGLNRERGNRPISMAVDVVDHNHLLDQSPAILSFVASEPEQEVIDRLRFLIGRLNNRYQRVVVELSGNYTRWKYEDREDLTQTPIVIHYEGGDIPEHPDLAFVGFTTQLFFYELSGYFRERNQRASESLATRLKEIADKVREKENELLQKGQPSPTIHQKLEDAILDILFLRTVWLAKQIFVKHLGTERARTLGGDLSYLDSGRDFLESFARFYRLDPLFVSWIWDERMPDGWDFPMVNPPRLSFDSVLHHR